jgi:hypothetical protein
MAKPNYDFAKRQRELAKKAKKEEKLKKKSGANPDGSDGDETADSDAETPAASDGAPAA